MKSITSALLVLFFLLCVGCEKQPPKDVSNDWMLPPELSEYKIYEIKDKYGYRFFVLVPSVDKRSATYIATEQKKGQIATCVILNGKKYNIIEAEE